MEEIDKLSDEQLIEKCASLTYIISAWRENQKNMSRGMRRYHAGAIAKTRMRIWDMRKEIEKRSLTAEVKGVPGFIFWAINGSVFP